MSEPPAWALQFLQAALNKKKDPEPQGKPKSIYVFCDPNQIHSDPIPQKPAEDKNQEPPSTSRKQEKAVGNDGRKQEKQEESVSVGKRQQQPANSKTEEISSKKTQNKPPQRKDSDGDMKIEDDNSFLAKKQPQSKPVLPIAEPSKANDAKIQSLPQQSKKKQNKSEPQTKPEKAIEPNLKTKTAAVAEPKKETIIEPEIRAQKPEIKTQKTANVSSEKEAAAKQQSMKQNVVGKSSKNKDEDMQMSDDENFITAESKGKKESKQQRMQEQKQEREKPVPKQTNKNDLKADNPSNQKTSNQKGNKQQKRQTQQQDDLVMEKDQDFMKPGMSINSQQNQAEQSSIKPQSKPPAITLDKQIKKEQPKKEQPPSINMPPINKASDRAQEDLLMEEDQNILQKQVALPSFVHNRPIKDFHIELLDTLKDNKNIGPQMLRWAQIQQKYLKQLRILIQLNKISENQLRSHGFNRQIFKELVNQKTIILQKHPLPSIVTEEVLNTDDFKKAFDQLEKIQSLLAPLEDGFNEQSIRNLYAFPTEMLLKTKQELYEQMLQKEVQQLEKQYSKIENQTRQIESILEKKKTQLKDKQEVKQVQAKKIADKMLQDHKEKTRKTLFPGPEDENRIIRPGEFSQEYKVIIKNREEMNIKLEELKEGKQMSQLKSTIENLRRQRLKEQQLLEKQKEKFEKYSINKKKNLNKQVYMGNVQKMKNNGKVKKLENEQKQLMAEYLQKKQMRAYRFVSKANLNSPIRFVSRIEE